jgi:4-cresol dehydrogenase (hydroxylating)
MMKTISNIDAFSATVLEKLGPDGINISEADLTGYGETTLPGPSVPPAAIAYPSSSEEVRLLVEMANQFRVPLYPISMGQNIGMGSRTALNSGQVIVDLGRRMKRIIEINEELAYCVVEPGVTFQALHEELRRRGSRLMISPTGGPPQGSVLGNAIDRGGGSGGIYSDHFGALCGIEIVLGNGNLVRTGDGSLKTTTSNWHLSKYSFGPGLDGLFSQSNYGIVTQAGVWLALRPPAIETFVLTFPDDDDLGPLVNLVRQLKMSNFVPTQIRIINDLYLIAGQESSPEYKPASGSLSLAARKQLQKKHGVGAWTVAGAFYGASREAIASQKERVRAHFAALAKGRFVESEEVDTMPLLQIVKHGFAGIPTEGELRMIRWRPGGGTTWFLPAVPMIGDVANGLHRAAREAFERFGMDYMVSHSCGARFARGIHTIVFNKQDPDESQRAEECYYELAEQFLRQGVSIGRAPTRYQKFHQSQRSEEFRSTCESIKRALDPNGIIAPGKYGISDAS